MLSFQNCKLFFEFELLILPPQDHHQAIPTPPSNHPHTIIDLSLDYHQATSDHNWATLGPPLGHRPPLNHHQATPRPPSSYPLTIVGLLSDHYWATTRPLQDCHWPQSNHHRTTHGPLPTHHETASGQRWTTIKPPLDHH
jgi:hypothetical protein